MCLKKGITKLMNRVHIVFTISDLQTYHEWMSLFPGLETRCEVMFMDDLSSKGYNILTDTFLKTSKKTDKRKPDEDQDVDQKDLVEGLVYTKEEIKTAMF